MKLSTISLISSCDLPFENASIVLSTESISWESFTITSPEITSDSPSALEILERAIRIVDSANLISLAILGTSSIPAVANCLFNAFSLISAFVNFSEFFISD